MNSCAGANYCRCFWFRDTSSLCLISSHYASGKSIFISLCTSTEMGETAEMNKLQMKTLMLEIECWRQLAHQAKICLEPKQPQPGSH